MPTHESFVHPFRLPHRGEERAHFNFCCTFAQQKTERPRGVVLSLSESLTEFRVRRRERCLIRFLPRPVRGRKHFARSERRIVRCQRTTEAQNAAKPSRKSGFATFSTVSGGPHGPPLSFPYPSCLVFSTAASTASMHALRKPLRSSAATPAMVLPPGLHTSSLSCPGCRPVRSTISALPSSICAA